MRLGDEDPSSHFQDRTGQGGGGLNLGGGAGMILGLVASRFGIVGVLVLLLGYCVLSSLGGGGGLLSGPGQQATSGKSTLDPALRDVMLRVLGSTERRWSDIFAANGQQYRPTTLVFYSGGSQSGCGAAQAAMGPFYCPTDQSIYLDTGFFNELSQRYGAPGDFAMAYVIAHEVGHHVQHLLGTLDRSQELQSRASRTEGNAVQVKVELQADCFAGVWAARDQNLLEAGDIEEGLRAAEAIGDDALQRQSQGVVVPESFTHGSSAQRMQALQTGLRTGDPAACATI